MATTKLLFLEHLVAIYFTRTLNAHLVSNRYNIGIALTPKNILNYKIAPTQNMCIVFTMYLNIKHLDCLALFGCVG